MARTKARLERDDWLSLGLTQLARGGPEALTLERITEAAGKTRGSFYHHFEDHGLFLTAIAERWLQEETDNVIALAEEKLRDGKRRETLARRAVVVDHALERQMRRLAAHDANVAKIVARSDEKRIAYVARLFRSELGLDPAEALARARIQHAAFVGAQLVFPDADSRFWLKLQNTLGRTLWRA